MCPSNDAGVAKKSTERSGDWYANLLWIERRKCLMFTHSETLFTLMVLDVRKAGVVPLGAFLVSKLHAELASEELPMDTFGAIDPGAVVIATTASRSVLGSMNNLAYLAEWAIMDSGGVRFCNVEGLNRSLRRTPMGAIGGAYGLDGAMALGRQVTAGSLGSNVIQMPPRVAVWFDEVSIIPGHSRGPSRGFPARDL